MKKKIVLFGVALAALATFNSCSNEDVLTQVVDTPAEEGEPLVVKLVDTDGTRGTDYTATSLPAFYLYSVKNSGSERWIGEYSTDGVSKGATFTGDNGTFTNNDSIKWKSGAWDFYALSDATFATETVGNEEKDAEHLDATDRNFTYTVNNDYNSQKDLLVAAVIGQQATTSTTVALPFQHALAQIGQITFKFSGLTEDNSSNFFVIKSITIHNLYTTGTMTFPATWSAGGGFTGTWSAQSTLGDYHVELPQFELDDDGNYKIFTHEDESGDNASEYTGSGFASGTKRGTTNVPNYFQCPIANGSWSYAMPFAKKTGSEGSSFGTYVASNATYTEDGGLYIIPQSLAKTVWTKNSSGEITGVDSGVYLEIHGIVLNLPELSDFSTLDETYVGGLQAQWSLTNINNYYITQTLNSSDKIVSYLVPLEKATKELKGGKLYNLTFNLAKTVSLNTGLCIFDGAEIE